MNTGEYVHFMSGAAGEDLSARAAQVFKGAFSRTDDDFAMSAGLPSTVLRHWHDLDPRMVKEAIDVFLKRAKSAKEQLVSR